MEEQQINLKTVSLIQTWQQESQPLNTEILSQNVQVLEQAAVSWTAAWQCHHNTAVEVSSAFIWWEQIKSNDHFNKSLLRMMLWKSWLFHLLFVAPPGHLMYYRTWWFLCRWSYPVNCFMFLDTLLNLNPSFCSLERWQIPDESQARTPETNLIGSFLAHWCPLLLDICWCLDKPADQSRQINHNPI